MNSKTLHQPPWKEQLRQELQPDRLIPTLTAGLITGVLNVIYAISIPALIFSGKLSALISFGIGMGLWTNISTGIVLALSSDLPGIVPMLQDTPAIILAVMVGAIAAQMPASTSPETLLATVLVAIALTTILTGISFFLLGRFRLGNLTRFMPYPVVGGFLAGVGYLLTQGAFVLLTDRFFTWTELETLWQPAFLLRWLPSLGMALLLLFLLRRFSNAFIVPTVIFVAIALFYLILRITGTSIAEARAAELLLPPFPEGGMWRPIQPALLTQVDWSLIAGQLNKIGITILLSVVGLLLNTSGIELAAKQDIDLNRELRNSGIANIISGLGSGLIGFISLGLTTFSRVRVGAKSRLVGVVVASIGAITLIFGESLISLFPKPVLGGVALLLGLSFLVEWIFDAWFRLSRLDYALVLLILSVIVTLGFLQGVAVGLLVAIALFVFNYSRVPVVRHALSGEHHLSNIARPLNQKRLLQQEGDQIYILALQGFVFFGNANLLVQQLQQRASRSDIKPVKFVVLDFRLVTGLDASTMVSFQRLQQLATQYSFQLVFTHLNAAMQQQLQRAGLLNETMPLFAELDRGVEWCESQVIEAVSWRRRRSLPLSIQLNEWFSSAAQVTTFMDSLEAVEVAAGEKLFQIGDRSSDLFFLEAGQMTLFLETEAGNTVRLQTVGAGAVLGQEAFFSHTQQTLTAIADQSSTLHRLSEKALQALQDNHPAVAIAFQKRVIMQLSDRVRLADQAIKNLF